MSGELYSPVADAAGILQLDAQGFLLDPSSPDSGLVGTSISGLPVWSAIQTAAHLARPGGTWADFTPDLVVSYSFGGAAAIAAGYEPFSTPEARAGAIAAMQLYAEVSGLTFVESDDPDSADITYVFGPGSTNGGGWANYPSAGGGYVHVGHVSWEVGMLPGSYALNLQLHELGHALGLAHPGDYNGDTAVYADADHFNDSGQYTNMSYWSETYTGASFSQLATLGLHDILAIQMEYGVNWSTRTGDTVYGFNSNAGNQSYDFGFDPTMGFSIWDGGGIDTLDFSGFSGGTVMDLRQGAFSSTGLETYNVSVAYGAIVEQAAGGSGNDRIRGNEVGNLLRGGGGHDLVYGGTATPPDNSPDPRDFVGIALNEAPLVRNQYLQANGIATFSGAAFTFEALIRPIRAPADRLQIASYNVIGNDNQFGIGGGSVWQSALGTWSTDVLHVTVAGNAEYVTDIPVERLIDGEPHRLSVSWDKATGTVTVHIDGALAHTGVYSASIGDTVRSGGVLILGQEQDSVGGGFDSQQVYQGLIGDIRLFGDVRTTQEVADNAFTRLTGSEQDLAHNWQASPATTTSIIDTVAGGTALSIANGAGTASTASAAPPPSDDDTLLGGLGNDTLYGGAGSDVLRGNGTPDSSPFAAITAIELNPTGTTSQYASVAGFGGLSGASGAVKFTIEMLTRISRTPGSEVDFFSYANGQTANALGLYADNNGTIGVLFRGADFDTGLPASHLTDGAEHRVSLSWDGSATGGRFVLYIDGVSVYTGVHANQASSLSAGGTLIFGQEQDAIGGGFDPNQILPGSIADIRIFNTVRSAAEIAANAFAPLASPESTPGLVANWRATAGNATSMIDARGGAALTLVGAPATTLFGGWDDDLIDGGAGADTLEGGNGADTLKGGEGNDRLYGQFGTDDMWGGTGNDIYYVTDTTDRVFEAAGEGSEIVQIHTHWTATAGQELEILHVNVASGTAVTGNELAETIEGNVGADTLTGGDGNDHLKGVDGSDSLVGGNGHDTLDGGTGSDVMTGGSGDDTYHVDNAGDQVIEAADGGSDTVYASLPWILPAALQIEFLRVSGTIGSTLTGNELGTALIGGNGADTLLGGGGNDTLEGGFGADRLYGQSGADEMRGGAGNDTYYVDQANDVVIEFSGAGYDTVMSLVDYTLAPGQHVEGLSAQSTTATRLTGNAFANDVRGNTGDDTLDGGDGNDTITGHLGSDRLLGGDGDDLLDGQAGNDEMIGGAGNDRYYVDAPGDVVVEAAGGGNDIVYATSSWAAAAGGEIETIRAMAAGLTLVGDAGRNVMLGSTGSDTLRGGAGNDRLYDLGGADHLEGGDDNDIYYVTHIGTTVHETFGAGFDFVQTTVDFTIGAGEAVEAVQVITGVGRRVTGNELGNELRGNAGFDILDGGAGADDLYGSDGTDTLAGGAGNDRLTGGTGGDLFVFGDSWGVDFVSDLQHGLDHIDLTLVTGLTSIDQLGFTLLGAGDVLLSFGADQIRVRGNITLATIVDDIML